MGYQKFTITNLDAGVQTAGTRSNEGRSSYHIRVIRDASLASDPLPGDAHSNDPITGGRTPGDPIRGGHVPGGTIGIVRGAGPLEIAAGEGWLLSFADTWPDLSLKYMGLLCQANHRPGRMFSFRVREEDLAAIEDLCVHMEKEMAHDLQMKERIVRSLLMVFLMYLNRIYLESVEGEEGGSGIGSDELVNGFFGLLDRHYAEARQPSEYASRLQVKPAYLNDVLKRNCGFTTSYLIQERIVTEALSLSRNSSMNMKEISFQLGFDDVSHFSKYFKKFSGKSYSMYRQQAV